MKKLLVTLFSAVLILVLSACGSKADEEATKTSDETTTDVAESKAEETEVQSVEIASTVDPRLQEPDEDTVCEMCNMKVYEKDHEMGMFSAQAIKADGSVSFYDDIGCLLNAEIANNETNEKFVRDFNTLEWAKVEDVTIVKTDLKTPMNWGYAYFVKEEDAQKYISEHDGAYIEELATIKEEAKKRREEKMKKQAEQKGNMGTHGEGMDMSGGTQPSHNH